MCKTNDNNPTRNPIRVAALTQLTSGLEYLRREPVAFNDAAVSGWCNTVLFAYNIGVLTLADSRAWFDELHRIRVRDGSGEFLSCEPTRCEDCGAVVPRNMTRDVGEIGLCDGCHAWIGDPRARDNEFVERGSDGHGDFEDTPAFMRGHPTELD